MAEYGKDIWEKYVSYWKPWRKCIGTNIGNNPSKIIYEFSKNKKQEKYYDLKA